MKKKKKLRKLNKENSKILRETMVTLGALKEQAKLNNLPIHEIQVHLLDEDGDGIVLCLEYDEQMEGINKTFHSIDEAAYDEYGENEENDDIVVEVELAGNDLTTESSFTIEEVISEEYDEILHSVINSRRKKLPPLLN
jgi:hypothetical protein